jgi:hypothetical protein
VQHKVGNSRKNISAHGFWAILPGRETLARAYLQSSKKIAMPYLAGCTGSLPAFVSQHAAKKLVRNSQEAAVIKSGG